jgi:hypothetical protein
LSIPVKRSGYIIVFFIDGPLIEVRPPKGGKPLLGMVGKGILD